MTDVLLALGSNLGDRTGYLRQAVQSLGRRGCTLTGGSALYATAPVSVPDGGEFLNAVVAVRTALAPRAVLELCLAIEADCGRVRRPVAGLGSAGGVQYGARVWASRTLDLDVLKYGAEQICEPGFIVPHPRVTERAFILGPLREVAPDWVIAGRTVSCWYDSVEKAGINRLDGTENWFWS